MQFWQTGCRKGGDRICQVEYFISHELWGNLLTFKYTSRQIFFRTFWKKCWLFQTVSSYHIYYGFIWLFYLRINQLDLKFQNLTPMFEFRVEGGRYIYKLNRSPMCEYMINFIMKLKHLPEKYMMNSVLENFTILQVNNSTYKSYLLVFYIQGIC